MCPEYYYAETPKKYGPPVEICRVNNDALTQDMVNRMCRNNCGTCSLYRSKHGAARGPQQQNQGGRSSGSSGVFGILVLAAAIAFVTKLLGIW